MTDTKPPVDPGVWVPAEAVRELQAALDKCQAENKGWRKMHRLLQEVLFNGRSRKDDFEPKP